MGFLNSKLNIKWPLPDDEAAAIAVSGGADSFALLHWAAQAGKPVLALTVDHGLREGSALEARAVADWCRERNIDHHTLVWEGEKPGTGIQDAARTARYRLLIEACYRLGIEHLVTAHTADDQAETVFMRLRRGAGRGLAGMPAERRIASGPGDLITLHRPMLSVRRSDARAHAEAARLPYIDDPSNEDEKYERVRVRALLAALEQQELLTVEALCGTAARIGLETGDILEGTGAVLRRCEGRERADGSYGFENWEPHGDGRSDSRVSPDPDRCEDFFRARQRAVDRVIGAIGDPSSRAQRSGDTGPMDQFFPLAGSDGLGHGSRIALRAPGMTSEEGPTSHGLTGAGTLRGVVLVPEGPKDLVIHREPAALLGRSDGTPGFAPIPAPPGSKHLYDRRFIVEVPGDAPEGLELRPLGQMIPRDIATSTTARQRIATLPCLALGNRVTHLPEQAVEAVTHALAGWKSCDKFLPSPLLTFTARSLLAERFAGDVIRY